MKTPLVTVAIPVYNAAAYLPTCLESVLAQSYGDFDVICIDDGSTDGSFAILQEYQSRDERIKIFQQINRGQYGTRNRLLDMARGTFLQFIDADDVMAPKLLEHAVDHARVSNSDILLFGWDYLDKTMPGPNVQSWNLAGWDRQDHTDPFPLAYGYLWMKLYRLAFLRRTGARFMEQYFCKADIPFHWFTMARAARLSCLPEVLYHYRVHESSTTAHLHRYAEHVIGTMEAIRHDLSTIGDPKAMLPAWRTLASQMVFKAYWRTPLDQRGKLRAFIRDWSARSNIPMGDSTHSDTSTEYKHIEAFYHALTSPFRWWRYRSGRAIKCALRRIGRMTRLKASKTHGGHA